MPVCRCMYAAYIHACHDGAPLGSFLETARLGKRDRSIFSYIVYRLQYDCSCTSSVGVGMQSPLVRACMCKCFCESL